VGALLSVGIFVLGIFVHLPSVALGRVDQTSAEADFSVSALWGAIDDASEQKVRRMGVVSQSNHPDVPSAVDFEPTVKAASNRFARRLDYLAKKDVVVERKAGVPEDEIDGDHNRVLVPDVGVDNSRPNQVQIGVVVQHWRPERDGVNFEVRPVRSVEVSAQMAQLPIGCEEKCKREGSNYESGESVYDVLVSGHRAANYAKRPIDHDADPGAGVAIVAGVLGCWGALCWGALRRAVGREV
jgi:hypothetical protein